MGKQDWQALFLTSSKLIEGLTDHVGVQDTAGAVPFVPGTPAGSPLRQGFQQGPALGPATGIASRATDGQAVGSTLMQPYRGDDSAKAGPSQGRCHCHCSISTAVLVNMEFSNTLQPECTSCDQAKCRDSKLLCGDSKLQCGDSKLQASGRLAMSPCLHLF